MSMLQYKNVWGRGNDPVPSIRNDFEYANSAAEKRLRFKACSKSHAYIIEGEKSDGKF